MNFFLDNGELIQETGDLNAFAGSSLVQETIIEISTLQGLRDINLDLTASYVLVNDIDCEFTGPCIGPHTSSFFSGQFDGQGYRIYNWELNTTDWYRALFGVVARLAVVKNFIIEGSLSTTNPAAALAIATIFNNDANGDAVTVSNIRAVGSVTTTSTSTSALTGGLLGSVGYAATPGGLTFSDCEAHVNVTAPAAAQKIGGFWGGTRNGTYTRCYSTGHVDAGTTEVGGFAGQIGGSVSRNYYDSTTSGRSDTTLGATPKTTAQMKQQATFTDWDFTNIWSIDEDVDYPRLRVFQADEGFVLVSPADTTSGLTKPVTLTWTAVVEATHYRLEIAETADTDFASPVKSELLEINEYSITDLPAAWYRWRVRYRM